MKRSFLLFSAALVLMVPGVLQAEGAQGAGATSETIAAQYNTLSAKVVAINKATHTLTLENDRAERRKLQVDPNRVKNFDNIKIGDMVVVREKQSLALSLTKHKKGEKPGTGAAMTVETAPPGAKPGIEGAETMKVSAEVVRIDTANQTVDLKGPEGNIIRLKARNPQNLVGLKKGDMIAATYTKAMAISVEPAPRK